jgi:hypothetical protein
MPVLSKEKLTKLLDDTLKLIDGDPKTLPKINESSGENCCIEINSYGYYYVCYERGNEVSRMLPFDEEHLLFIFFKDITSYMSYRRESKNTIPEKDRRRLQFEKQIELMTKIKPYFGDKLRQELDWILRNNP